MTEKNKHHALMLEYVKDWAISPFPWEMWEFKESGGDDWDRLSSHPAWREDTEYRHKPRTITVNGVEVPEPMRVAPELGAKYWLVILDTEELVGDYHYNDSKNDVRWLNLGLIHATKEAAIAHAKALLLPSEMKND